MTKSYHCAECRDAARTNPPDGAWTYNSHIGAYEQTE